MTRMNDLNAKWMKNGEYRREYEALEEEFALSHAMIEARSNAGLKQEELARRMGASQSVILRPETGRSKSSASALKRFECDRDELAD